MVGNSIVEVQTFFLIFGLFLRAVRKGPLKQLLLSRLM